MLPSEVFAEAVAFLPLFDLNSLAVANALCSSLAVNASAKIRWEEFAGFLFRIEIGTILIYRRMGSNRFQFVASLNFPSEAAMVEFIAAAFPNCIFGDLAIFTSPTNPLLEALGKVASSVIIKGAICPPYGLSDKVSLKLIRKFRTVQALQLSRTINDDEANEIANFYGGNGIRELHYYRSCRDRTPNKLALD